MHELFKLVDVDKKNILHFSILSKDNLIIKSVLDWLKPHRAVLTFLLRGRDYKGNTPFHLACQLGRLEELTEEFVGLHSSQDLLMVNELDQTPFHVAAKSGSLRMLACLHARDQEKEDIFLINKNDIDQCTPLHLAAMNTVIFHHQSLLSHVVVQKPDSVEYLLSAGADPKSLNSYGQNPLCSAAKEYIQPFLYHFYFPNFDIYLQSGDFASMKLIVESNRHVDINSVDINKTTALHIAAREGHHLIVDYLLTSGARVTMKDYKNRTPLEMAIDKEKKYELIEL